MKTSPHLRLPFMLALFVALFDMPTSVYQVCAWNVGTLDTEPWHRKLTAGCARMSATIASRLRAWFGASGGFTGLPALTCLMLIAAITLHYIHPSNSSQDVMLMGLTGLKAYRDRDADLKGQIAKAKKDKAAIGDACVTEKRAMTDAERTAFAAFTPTIAGLEAQLSDNTELLTAAEAANEAERNFQAAGARVEDPDSAAAAAAAKAAGVQQPKVEVVDRAKQPGFFGRYLQAVRTFAIEGGAAHTPKADMDVLKAYAAPTGLNTDVPSDGGFLVQPDRASSIIQRAYCTGEVLALVNRMPIGPNSNGMKLPAIDETSRADNSRFGGIVSGWLGQGNTLTAGKPKFREMDLKLRKVGAFCYATDEQLADAVALEAWINTYLPKELTFRVEDAVVNGDGSNKPAGFLNSGAAITVTRTTASRVKYEDVSAMWKRMWAPLRRTAVWLVDQSVEQELEQMSVAVGTAGELLLTAGIYKPAGVAFGPDGTQGYSPATLYGRPILTTEYGANLGTVGDICLVNLGEYVLIDKGGIDQAVSLHVAFLTDEAVYRFLYRVDGQLTWQAALTPKSGGATLSPVITLT